MLIVQCANEVVVWIFVDKRNMARAAHCANDAVEVTYSLEPGATWIAMIRTVIAHSILIGGAIQQVVWCQP